MHPSKLTPVKIGYDDGLGNTEYVTAYTAEQMADALESAMDAVSTNHYDANLPPEMQTGDGFWEVQAWRAKIKELRGDKE